MARTLVTLDLGNSRLKLRRWTAVDGARPRVDSAHDLDVDERLADLVDELVPADLDCERIALSSVASPAIEDEITQRFSARFRDRFVARPDAGLEIELAAPERVGRDRLFAARGAASMLGTHAIVVDAGTCVTVDAVAAPTSSAAIMRSPRFLGGAIAPGPRLLAEALAHGGARLFVVDPRPNVAALGTDTRTALLAGVVVGLRGSVRELVLRIAAEVGFDRPPIVWTGGAREFLLDPPLFPERVHFVEPDLVHLGLLAALGVRWPRVG